MFANSMWCLFGYDCLFPELVTDTVHGSPSSRWFWVGPSSWTAHVLCVWWLFVNGKESYYCATTNKQTFVVWFMAVDMDKATLRDNLMLLRLWWTMMNHFQPLPPTTLKKTIWTMTIHENQWQSITIHDNPWQRLTHSGSKLPLRRWKTSDPRRWVAWQGWKAWETLPGCGSDCVCCAMKSHVSCVCVSSSCLITE